MENNTDQILFLGQETTIVLPSGRSVITREPNGNDDDLLSNNSGEIPGSIRYLASLLVKDISTGEKPTVEDIMSWGTMDVNYALFKIRRIHQGDDIEFEHECENTKCNFVTKFEENLAPLDGNLGDKNYRPSSVYQVPRYPAGTQPEIEMTTSTGRGIKFNILNHHGEKIFASMTEESRMLTNAPLLVRNLRTFHKDKWVEVKSFQALSSREMKEIRQKVEEVDGSWAPISKIVCPKCGRKDAVNLMLQPNFFY